MKKDENIEKELKGLSPLLSKMRKEQKDSGYIVPPTYFRNLTEEMMHQRLTVVPNETSKGWWERLLILVDTLVQPKLVGGLATITLLIFGGFYFINKPVSVASITSAEVSLAELEQYLAAHVDELSEEMLVEQRIEDASVGFELDVEDQVLEYYFEEILEDLKEEDLEQFL